MRFDQVHGTAIELSSDRRTATRSTEHFCNGIAFSAGQVSVGSKICLELTRSTEWSGALRIGFTSHDPSKINPSQLPRYVCPDLTSRNGYWARPIHEEYADTGNRLTFYYNSAGQVHYFINNEHKGVLLSELPVLTPLWAMIDFYGNSTSATLVPADEAPVEIVARGPEALHAYHKACESGTQPVYRTRLMFVGQDRVGKTSLMKSLTGQSYNEAENATDGIDLSASCSFNLRDRQAWHLAIQSNRSPRNSVTSDITEDSITASSLAAVPPSPGTPAIVPGTPGMQPGTAYQWPQKYQNYQHQGLQQSHSRQVSPVKSPGTMQIYEEEYHYALATNIVQELLHHQKLLDRAAVVKGAEATPSAPPDKHPAKVPKSATSDRRRSSTSDRVRKMAGSGDKRGRNTSSDTTAKRDDLNRKPSSLSISPRKSTSGSTSGVNATVNSSATTANPTSCDSSVNPATAVSSVSEAPLTTSSADIRRENYVESHQPDSWALRSQELLQEVPDRVAELVEELWHKRRAAINISTDTHSSHDSDSPENGKRGQRARSRRPRSSKNIVLNIWDFSGQAAFYTTHQVFLSSRAVYVIVFNLCHDLYSGTVETTDAQSTEQENIITVEGSTDTTEDCLEPMTPLDYLDYWLNSIHAHAAENTAFIENGVHMNSAQPHRREERSEVLEDSTGGAGGHTSGAKDGIPSGQIDLSPPIFIVGTHRNRLHADKDVRQRMVEEKFALIRQFVQNKVYHHHIVPQYYAIENNMEAATNDQQLVELKRHIEEVASKEPYMGEQIPLSWLRFEQDLLQLVEDETCFSSIAQTREVAKEEGIMKESEFKTMLEFYHDLGVIVYYGGVATLDMLLRSTVILKPQWLIDTFQKILTATQPHPQSGLLCDLWQRFNKGGILEEKLIDHLWTEETNQKAVLLALMERLDLICEKKNRNANPRVVDRQGHSYYVPNRLRHCTSPKTLYLSSNSDVVFYLDFNGFLPDGLFHRLMTRSIRWSQECGGHEPELFYRKARLFLDSEHDFCLEMSTSWLSRVKVSVLRMEDLDESDEESSDSVEDRPMPPPKPAACARVRNFLESTLSDLRELWMKRISYQTLVQCYCDKPCYTHIQPRCTQPMCLHFLNLDECLSNKIVCCEHRRIKTGQYRRWFPMAPKIVKAGPILPDNVVQKVNEDMYGNIEAKGPEMPGWVKSAAKLLNGGSDGQDWTALAGKLGYKKNKTEKFGDDLNPGLALITDWIISSGNTSMSVDMLITYLETMLREDIVDIIQHGQASEISPPSVFISYQWDSQDEVNTLRNRLEVAGFPCWMDIGQMGGGDQLYTKVEEGIRNAKVVLACITPKYTVSHYCNRELNLADLLRKPIIPVMYEKVRWPPPGGMALVFSQLVYINMKGVGGHGGSGIHADLENKYQEILQRVVYNVKPEPHINLELTPITSESETSDNQSSLGVGQNGSPHTSQMPIVIPGYRSDSSSGGGRRPLTSGEMRTVIRLRNTAPNGHDGPEGTGPRGRGDAEGEGPVEQVHVTKCAVCTIM